MYTCCECGGVFAFGDMTDYRDRFGFLRTVCFGCYDIMFMRDAQ